MDRKIITAGIALASLLLFPFSTHVYASIDVNNRIGVNLSPSKQIRIGGTTVLTMPGIVYQGTTYIPIWYVMQAIKQLGLSSVWGTNQLDISVPSKYAVDLTHPFFKNDVNISLNGTQVMGGQGLTHVDPSSGKNTTFVPIYNLELVFQRVGIQSSWDGTTWSLTLPKAIAYSDTTTKHIYANGTLLSSPASFVANGTTYMPIWYLMNALKQFGVQSTWDGQAFNVIWGYLTPSMLTQIGPNSSTASTGNGDSAISVDGVPKYFVHRMTRQDPASHQDTTYMPIWHLMNVLSIFKIQSTWDGTNWILKQNATETKGNVIQDLVSTLNLNAPTSGASPYTDVPAESPYWSSISRAISAGIVKPDSDTVLGLNDAVTLQELDEMVWKAQNFSASEASLQPGNTVIEWANTIGLNRNLQTKDPTSALTLADEQQVYQNELALEWHFYDHGNNTFDLVAPVHTLLSRFQADSVHYPTPDSVKQAGTMLYKTFNAVQFSVPGNTMIVSMPTVAMDNPWRFVVSGVLTQISFDGGQTWSQTEHGYDSKDPNSGGSVTPPSDTVWIKTTDRQAGLTVELYAPGNLLFGLSISGQQASRHYDPTIGTLGYTH